MLVRFRCHQEAPKANQCLGKIWNAEKYPWQTVAKIVIPKQDSFNYELKSFWEDHMRIDPWHGLVSLQPLGSPNRLRRVGRAFRSFRWHLANEKHSISCKLQVKENAQWKEGDTC